ncbi:MAG: hypothetical protein JWN71_3575 [Xanthobacteraceae bacterium]|nr:hypothetical protein [Xanthobacteraceae bacterium]
MWLLRSRFVQFEFNRWQRLTLPFHRLTWAVRNTIRRTGDRLFAKARIRAYLDKVYPFRDPNASHPGQWIIDDKIPGGRKWEGQRTWRTRIGLATICWECGSPSTDAWNVRLPDGRRADVRQSAVIWQKSYAWRRRAVPPLVWAYGTLQLHDSDIEFIDLDEQPSYSAPPLADIPMIEAELARSSEFIADLQDDAFAMMAFHHLSQLEWMKIGHREYHAFNGSGEVAHMIAGLRRKGETYIDVEFALSGRDKPPKITRPDYYAALLQWHLKKIGWRTHTHDEIHAMRKENFRQRLAARVEVLREVQSLEQRSSGSCDSWLEKPRPRLGQSFFMYESDDPAWLSDLSAEEKVASSAELIDRLDHLAATRRISKNEYDVLRERTFNTFFG